MTNERIANNEYDYYRVHSDNKQGWKTVKIKKQTYKCYSPFQLESIIREKVKREA